MSDDKVKFKLEVDNKQAVASLAAVDAATARVGESADRSESSIQDLHDSFELFENIAGKIQGAVSSIVGLTIAADSSHRAITLLGDGWGAVSVATNGAVASTDALRVQQGLLAAQLPVTGAQLGTITREAREFAIATGTETTAALGQMSEALRTGAADALGRFGIQIEDTHTRVGNYNAAIHVLEERHRGISASALTAAESMDRFKAGVASLAQQMAGLAAGPADTLLRFLTRITGMSIGIGDVIREVGDAGDVQAAQIRRDAEAARRAPIEANRARFQSRLQAGHIQMSESQVARIGGGQGMRNLTNEERNQLVMSGRDDGTLDQAQFERNIETFERQHYERLNREMMAAEPARIEALKASERAKRAARGQGRSGGGGHRAPLRARAAGMPNSVDELLDIFRGHDGPMDDTAASAAFGAFRSPDFDSTADGIAALRNPEQERANRRSNRDQAIRRGSLASDQSLGGGMARSLGVNDDAIGTSAKMWQGYSDTAVSAIGKVTDALGTHLAAVISGKETMGQALLMGANEVASAMAKEALPKAGMSFAAGLVALTNPITAATAPLHFTAAGVYAGIAATGGLVALGTGAALSGPSAPVGTRAGGAAVGASRSASGSSRASKEDRGAINIYNNSLVPPGPRELQTLVQATAQAGRYGLNAAPSHVVRV